VSHLPFCFPYGLFQLDFLVKSLENGKQMTKEEFKAKYNQARKGQQISDHDVDYLFELLDYERDGVLGHRDFDFLERNMLGIEEEAAKLVVNDSAADGKLKLVPHSNSKQHMAELVREHGKRKTNSTTTPPEVW
jgi:hypothetical protein